MRRFRYPTQFETQLQTPVNNDNNWLAKGRVKQVPNTYRTRRYSFDKYANEQLIFQQQQRQKQRMIKLLDRRLIHFIDYINYVHKELQQRKRYQDDINYQRNFDILFKRILQNLHQEWILTDMVVSDIRTKYPQILYFNNELHLILQQKKKKLSYEIKQFRQKRQDQCRYINYHKTKQQELSAKIYESGYFGSIFSFAQENPNIPIVQQDQQKRLFETPKKSHKNCEDKLCNECLKNKLKKSQQRYYSLKHYK